jgi:hypothetical protein
VTKKKKMEGVRCDKCVPPLYWYVRDELQICDKCVTRRSASVLPLISASVEEHLNYL